MSKQVQEFEREKIPYEAVVGRIKTDADFVAEEAYRRGVNDQAEEDAKIIEQLIKEKEEAYQKCLENSKIQKPMECKGCKYENDTREHLPCDYCSNCFRNQWEAKEDEIKIGDEIKNTLGVMEGATGFFIGFSIENGYKVVKVLRHDDNKIFTGVWTKENCVKTGNHSDAVEILLNEMNFKL